MGQDENGTPKRPTAREINRNPRRYMTETPRGGAVGFGAGGRKSSPERLTKFLDRLMKFPEVYKACAFAGFSYNSLLNYLAKSETGRPGDGFDLTYGDERKRFHQHYADVIQAGVQMVEDGLFRRAINGYYEVLHDKGRVQYQIDPELAGLGLTGPDAYLLDENRRPIPERIEHQDPDVMLAVLRAFRRDRYGAKESLDVTVRGGVMVVSPRAKSSTDIEQMERELLAAPLDVEFREVEDE